MWKRLIGRILGLFRKDPPPDRCGFTEMARLHHAGEVTLGPCILPPSHYDSHCDGHYVWGDNRPGE